MFVRVRMYVDNLCQFMQYNLKQKPVNKEDSDSRK